MAALLVGVAVVAAGCVPDPTPPGPEPSTLALAYSNLDGVPGYDASGSDVLIAKLVDTNADHIVSAGDTVMVNKYPLNLDATAFGTFQVASDAIVSGNASSTQVNVSTPTAQVVFSDSPRNAEFFQIQRIAGTGGATFQDSFEDAASDLMVIYPISPFSPDTALPLTIGPSGAADAHFVDVDISVG